MSPKRSVEGVTLDGTVQHFADRPYDGETVDVVDEDLDEQGDVTATNVPTPDDGPDAPDEPGQSTWDDWRWSA